MMYCLWLGTALLLPINLLGQTLESRTTDDNQAAKSRASRLMQKLDKDGNGKFEKRENPAVWQRYKKLDANQDGVLTAGELRQLRPIYLETGAKRHLDVVYKQIDKKKLQLDFYFPTQKDRKKSLSPVVVYTHGGGWAAGSKQGAANGSFKTVFLRLLEKGFAVASVNYRLCKKDSGVTMRDCVIDSKDAVRYLAKNAKTYAIDPNQFFIMGDSAGGHIAQMLLLTSPKLMAGDKDLATAEFRMVAGVSWYGPCDFENMDLFNHSNSENFRDRFAPRILGSDNSDKLKRYREISPINYLRQDSPPLLMIQGDKDTTIPVKHAYFMKKKAEEVKAPVDVMIVKNAGHNWRKVGAEIDPSREMIVERSVQFFVDHLGSRKPN